MNEKERFSVVSMALNGLVVFEGRANVDARGSFERIFSSEVFEEWGINTPIIQINQSTTRTKGTVRGLHLQRPPFMEDKVVSCMRGSVFDVAVDIRQNSASFLQWHGEVLSAENKRSVVIPKGFAHGFQTLTDDVTLQYLHTERYVETAEDGINMADPSVGIVWPLPLVKCSERDRTWPLISSEFEGVAM